MALTKWLAFGDLHFGYTKKITPSGAYSKAPVHDQKAFDGMLEFAKAYKPDKILLMGDQFDMKPVSRHELNIAKKQEGQRLVEVYNDGYEKFIKPILSLPNSPELHWFDGNHEAWAYQLADQFPGIDGLIDPYRALGLSGKMIFHPQGDVYKLGKLAVAHGDTLVTSPTNGAKKAVERYGSSIRIWHFHTYQAYTREVLKNEAYQTGKLIPCLCTRNASYWKSPVTAVVHGFNYGAYERNGEFYDETPIIWKGKFLANGKVYGGK